MNMNKYLIWGGAALLVLVGGFFSLNSYIYNEKQGESNIEDTASKLDRVGEKDFEGEADPDTMSLTMKTWILERGMYGSFEFVPPTSKKFTITFKRDGTFSATTDCNGMGGKYSTNGGGITFGEIYMTEMYCEDSKEAEFSSIIGETFKYRFTSRGELIFELSTGKGSATFR